MYGAAQTMDLLAEGQGVFFGPQATMAAPTSASPIDVLTRSP